MKENAGECLSWLSMYGSVKKILQRNKVEHAFEMFGINSQYDQLDILQSLRRKGFSIDAPEMLLLYQTLYSQTLNFPVKTKPIPISHKKRANSPQKILHEVEVPVVNYSEALKAEEQNPDKWSTSTRKWKQLRDIICDQYPALQDLVLAADLYKNRYTNHELLCLLSDSVKTQQVKDALVNNFLFESVRQGYFFAIKYGYDVEDCVLEACTLLVEYMKNPAATIQWVTRLMVKYISEGLHQSFPPNWFSYSMDEKTSTQQLQIELCVDQYEFVDSLLNAGLAKNGFSTDQIENIKHFIPLSCDAWLSSCELGALYHMDDYQLTSYLARVLPDDYFDDQKRAIHHLNILNIFTEVPSVSGYEEMLNYLPTAYECLSPREYNVLVLCYGLFETPSHTYEECGKYFNITRERIRQIIAKAQRKLGNRIQYMIRCEERHTTAQITQITSRTMPIAHSEQQSKPGAKPTLLPEITDEGLSTINHFHEYTKKDYTNPYAMIPMIYRTLYLLRESSTPLLFEEFANQDAYFSIVSKDVASVHLQSLMDMGLIIQTVGRCFSINPDIKNDLCALDEIKESPLEEKDMSQTIVDNKTKRYHGRPATRKGQRQTKRKKTKAVNKLPTPKAEVVTTAEKDTHKDSKDWGQSRVELEILYYMRKHHVSYTADELSRTSTLRDVDRQMIEDSLESLTKKHRLICQERVRIVSGSQTNWTMHRETIKEYQIRK